MASDSKDREAIERTARRIKEHNEKTGASGEYEKAVSEARKVAIDADRADKIKKTGRE